LIVKAIVEWWKRRQAHQVLLIGWQEQYRAETNTDLPS